MQSLPRQLYNVAQVKELERIAIENYGIAGYELMTRAGQAVFDLIKCRGPQPKQITVFCGTGNNAGDGFVVARLGLLAGLQVTVYNLLPPDNLHGDAQRAYRDFVAAGGITTQFASDLDFNAGVIVDALLGTGLIRPVTGLFKQAIEHINQHTAVKVAIDIPSGLQADTGMVLGAAVKADFTVSFIGLKQGLFTGMAADYCGDLSYADLGVPHRVFDQVNSTVSRILPQPLAKRSRCAHKGKFGHVLVIGGDLGYSGAARLAGEAAARVGAGLVSIATRKAHAISLNATRPELMCHGIENADELTGLLAKASVIVIGPGLGQGEWGRLLFNVVITSTTPLVVDADGLNLLAQSAYRQKNWVLTPHPGEAARLLNSSTAQLQADRFISASALQASYGGVVVLKGPGSLVATHDGIAIATTGNPGMASGGMGDVLSGVIAGLLAQGLSTREATEQAVYLHGLAADRAAQADGERGILAGDLLPYLRKLVN
jgi:ADP-dependent NAD(P)H-hydrate dehydratase / NAD(P)H-hydrate epimerase